MSINTKIVGARVYVTGDTYALKDKFKEIGCHWDSERKQWWIGKTKQDKIEEFIKAQTDTQQVTDAEPVSFIESNVSGYIKPTAEELSRKPCHGKVEYKGKTYFVVSNVSRNFKRLLTVLDCSISFWVDVNECKWVKHYQQRNGVAQTVGAIRQFVEQRKNEKKQLKEGNIPAGWCVDLEDGCVKPRHECDMPAN